MAEQFSQTMCAFFNCVEGTYSKLTAREYGDSQLTVSGVEKDLFQRHFGRVLEANRGGVKALADAGHDSSFQFRRWPDGEAITLNLVYPKPEKNELRLYLAESFKPAAGRLWCSFLKDGEMWVGSFTSKMYDEILSGPLDSGAERTFIEPETGDFQSALNSLPEKRSRVTDQWGRDPSVAREAIIAANYTCELFSGGRSFISRATGKPFMEAHHLVPMKLQSDFGVSLDVVENICSLSPDAHRFVHHGVIEEVRESVLSLASGRAKFLDQIGVGVDELLTFYG